MDLFEWCNSAVRGYGDGGGYSIGFGYSDSSGDGDHNYSNGYGYDYGWGSGNTEAGCFPDGYGDGGPYFGRAGDSKGVVNGYGVGTDDVEDEDD